jgi:ketol-acid reductoisomerase
MANYFNSLPLRLQLEQLGVCEFMDQSEFADGIKALKGKKVVIVGCGAQGLNQVEHERFRIRYFLRAEPKQSPKLLLQTLLIMVLQWELMKIYSTADLVCNLTPDKQHTAVVTAIMPLKKGSTLSYSHGFNIVEEGMQIRKDITVMCAQMSWI